MELARRPKYLSRTSHNAMPFLIQITGGGIGFVRALDRGSRLGRSSAFLCLCVASAVIWWKPCLATVYLALRSPEYSHIQVVIPISIALILLRQKTVRGSVAFDPTLGIPVLLLS